jgi:hypothetical protein
MVRASGVDPLDSLVLRRRERVDQKLDGSHSVTSSHSALNMHLRQNLGTAQQDIENLIAETQESFKMYTDFIRHHRLVVSYNFACHCVDMSDYQTVLSEKEGKA